MATVEEIAKDEKEQAEWDTENLDKIIAQQGEEEEKVKDCGD